MKKALIVFVVLLLAVPAVSFAGSATSRWDMTIGGYVKADVVWNDIMAGPDSGGPAPVSSNVRHKTNSLTWASGQTTLNFAIKGPDAMGAKTSAFVEGWFHGRNTFAGGFSGPGSNGDYGLFSLTHAYFQMVWPKTTLLFGRTWMPWGFAPFLNLFSPGDAHINKGFPRNPQIRLTQMLTKNFTVQLGAMAPYDTDVANNLPGLSPGPAGQWPDASINFDFTSDACGKIGPFGLKMGIGGFYGKDKYIFAETSGVTHNKELDRYGAQAYFYIPIIPERKLGNKAGAWAIAGAAFRGNGMSAYYSPWISGPSGAPWVSSGAQVYIRGASSVLAPAANGTIATTATGSRSIARPMVDGGWLQTTFYLTNQWWFNAFYGALYNNYSSRLTAANLMKRNQELAVAILYDVNPAIRFGVQYSQDWTGYANHATATTDSKGKYTSVRFGAWYFF